MHRHVHAHIHTYTYMHIYLLSIYRYRYTRSIHVYSRTSSMESREAMNSTGRSIRTERERDALDRTSSRARCQGAGALAHAVKEAQRGVRKREDVHREVARERERGASRLISITHSRFAPALSCNKSRASTCITSQNSIACTHTLQLQAA